MKKHILILLFSIVSLSVSPKIAAINLMQQLNENQRNALKEYMLKKTEQYKGKADAFLASGDKLFPLMYSSVQMMISHEEIVQIVAATCAAEEHICKAVEKNPALKSALAAYSNTNECEMFYKAGFNSLISWNYFKILYAIFLAGMKHDVATKKMCEDVMRTEAIALANSLIAGKK